MDIHPKSLRIAFEKGSTDYLHKKYTKDRFREDPEYYNKVLAEQRKKLTEKINNARNIAFKKGTWGTVEVLSGSAFSFLTVAFFKASLDFARTRGQEAEAGALFGVGWCLAFPGGYLLLNGGEKLWMNYSTARVTNRLTRHDFADQQVRNYLDEVFGTKESDDVKSS